MKDLLKVFAIINFIATIIAAIVLAYTYGQHYISVLSTGYMDRSWGTTIGIFVGVFVGGSAWSALLGGLSEVLSNQEEIKGKLRHLEMENEAEGPLAKAALEHDLEVGDKWRCPNCGRINDHLVGTCACGADKPV